MTIVGLSHMNCIQGVGIGTALCVRMFLGGSSQVTERFPHWKAVFGVEFARFRNFI